jgi:RNA polymerase sigma factor for flagellar operon FliA
MSGLKEYRPLVVLIARKTLRGLPGNIELDDLVQVGMIALDGAIRDYIPEPGAKFETYASLRIRGAILDELRRNDPLTRAQRKTGDDVFLNSLEDSLEVFELAEPGLGPLGELEDKRRAQALAREIRNLRPRERYVMELHYDHDMKLKEIGVILGVSESRVCQMIRDITVKLRKALNGY